MSTTLRDYTSDTRTGATKYVCLTRRRDEWITAEIFQELEVIALESYDKFIGLELENLVVDGCIV